MFKRIDHIEIVTDRLDRTVQFYTDVLGFREKARDRIESSGLGVRIDLVYLDLGGTVVELISYEGASVDPAPEKEHLGYRMMSWSLPKASIGSPEPPLPRLCSAEGSWRRKTRNETDDFSRAFLSQTAATPRKVETNGSAQRVSNPRGASQDHGTSRSADRALCRTQRGDGKGARGTRQDRGGGGSRRRGHAFRWIEADRDATSTAASHRESTRADRRYSRTRRRWPIRREGTE
jgi:catechol 2,3-dioxygenase-like lactoylglutathione lyase family enzyme